MACLSPTIRGIAAPTGSLASASQQQAAHGAEARLPVPFSLKTRSAHQKQSSARSALLAGSPLQQQKQLRRRYVRARSAIRSQAEEEELSPDNCSVLVAGGGGVGMECVRQLSTAGAWVTVLQRHEKFRKEIEGLGAILEVGDVLKPATIDKALKNKGLDFVVSTVGAGMAHQGTPDYSADSQGNINLIEAAKKAGIKRFILVTSIGTGDSVGALSPKELEVLGPCLKEKAKAEEHLKNSGLTWTIIRPGGLLSKEPTGKGILTEDTSVLGLIHRPDVASLVFKCLFDRKSHNKVLSVVDSTLLKADKTLDQIEQFTLA